ncbi:Chromosome partitioning ATPase, Mrp family, contains Fe-S cluster [Rhodoblastus acidophilus]|uniref:Chromosome partitioning ATPase, Mrp family, contains Fe-S cluster n=1 Tax=Rhodoblastus acidophilus TaxID=1074 RepID=A0A212REV2_RHOAC|nr:cellulose synthase operon protein YhjQ/BcsQ [Rhodoblastus acidophilus]PPQ39711.1 hypothetical protein CKO16_05650 [Rhodoblastus acidophilus]RAI16790.1 hypothetical protein CH337_19505 [Rhodoblastus acidophilus]SNB70788.1 Chromosome partitioning ATPase, Mrp family, contains Fe-S cluster [Rhodoblastus acidophilus]
MTEVLEFEPRGRGWGEVQDFARDEDAQRSEFAGRFSPLLGMVERPVGGAAETIRSIRAALMSAGFGRGGLALVAPRGGQGTTVLAANLALAFAQLEVKTLLVDANLRRPGLGALFGVAGPRAGLAECLARREAEPPLVRGLAPHLALLPAGAPPSNPQDLIASVTFAGLTARWAEAFDLVIYDSPPALESADAALIAARAGAAMITARLDSARYDEVRRVGDDLRGNGCVIAGVVGAGFA